MHIVHFFPIILMTLNLAAALTYLWFGNIWMFVYWISAFTLTGVVTFKP